MTKLPSHIFTASAIVLTVGLACGLTNNGIGDSATPNPSEPATDSNQNHTQCIAQVVEQSYENGFMFWIGRTSAEKCASEHSFGPGTGEIWVAYVNSRISTGKWQVFVDDWTAGADPESDLSLSAPAGLLQPVRGFGKVWRMRLTQDERELIGWATGTEFLITSDYRYEGDVFVNSQGDEINRPGSHTLIGLAGDIFTFDEISQTVQYTAPPSP